MQVRYLQGPLNIGRAVGIHDIGRGLHLGVDGAELGGEFHDTILISANPFAERLPRNTFFKFVSVAETTGAIATDPAVVTELAAEVARTHPDKRIVVHYMQPHTPHLGGVNDRFKQCGISGVDDREEDDTYSVWEAVKNNLITHAELRESYIENLHIVEAECQRLCELLEGKTVITSDHGEHLGERKPVFRY